MKKILTAAILFSFTIANYCQTPCPGIPTVTYAGKTYNTVKIKNQCWLKENLDVGNLIPVHQASKDNNVIEKYCYNDSLVNCSKYGGLYQWDEMMQYSKKPGSQGICPKGWHIPTRAEFMTLSAAVGGKGNALKRKDQGRNSGIGTNTSGFTAVFGGYNYNNDKYESDSREYWRSANFQTSTEVNKFDTYYFYMVGEKDMTGTDSSSPKTMGYSVRCIKD